MSLIMLRELTTRVFQIVGSDHQYIVGRSSRNAKQVIESYLKCYISNSEARCFQYTFYGSV